MARVTVLAGVACLLHSGCRRSHDDSAWWDGEREKVELRSRLDLLKYRCGSEDSGSAAELASMTAEAGRLAKTKERMTVERMRLLTELASLESAMSSPDSNQRKLARESALGLRFETLAVADGRSFENVRIVKIEDGGVSIRHEHGAATLKYQDLTPEQRDKFGLEAGSALAAEHRSAEQQAAYDRWMDREMEVVEKRRQDLVAREAEASERASRLRAATLARAEASHSERPLARAATPFGTGSVWRNSWYGDYGYSGYSGYPYRRRTVYYYTPSTSYAPSYHSSSCGSTGTHNWQNQATGGTHQSP